MYVVHIAAKSMALPGLYIEQPTRGPILVRMHMIDVHPSGLGHVRKAPIASVLYM